MKKIIALGLAFSSPLLASAATACIPGAKTTITCIIETLIGYLGYILPVLITIAIIYFVWGVIQFMTTSEEEAKKMARTKIINGLIGLFVIVAFWGIIGIVKTSFGVGEGTGANIVPCTPRYDASGVQLPC